MLQHDFNIQWLRLHLTGGCTAAVPDRIFMAPGPSKDRTPWAGLHPPDRAGRSISARSALLLGIHLHKAGDCCCRYRSELIIGEHEPRGWSGAGALARSVQAEGTGLVWNNSAYQNHRKSQNVSYLFSSIWPKTLHFPLIFTLLLTFTTLFSFCLLPFTNHQI